MYYELFLELIYALNTMLSLIFFFLVFIYLVDSEDLRTQKNLSLLGFYLAVTGYFLSYYLYISFSNHSVIDTNFYSFVSVLSIVSLVVVLIFLFLFVVLEAIYPYKAMVMGLVIGLYILVGIFTVLDYLIEDVGTWIHNQLVFSNIGLLSIFILAELLIIFTVCVSFFKSLRHIFFPEYSQSLINYPYLYYFALGISLGGVSEIFKIYGHTTPIQLLGVVLSTFGLLITTLIIIRTRKHIKDIAWRIVELQLEELKELDVLKHQFIDTTSHEMRTPLTVIWGYIELLKRDIREGRMTTTQHEKMFAAMERNYRRMESLLNRIFDLSRLRRGLFELNIQKADLREIIEISVNDMKRFVEKEGLQISFINRINDEFYFANVDPSLLDQVVRNLIENSVKFTEEGKIVIALTTKNK
ncbi:MAG: sensor histidine kinase, partial [Candidatus Hodarchaeota archaeon]